MNEDTPSNQGENSHWYRSSNELGKSFFDRWSILSAGTFTLLIPLIQSLGGKIHHKPLLIIVESLLLMSLFSSSIHPWIASKIALRNAFPENKSTFYMKFQKINHLVAIFSYPVAILLLVIFINLNIF